MYDRKTNERCKELSTSTSHDFTFNFKSILLTTANSTHLTIALDYDFVLDLQ